MYIAYYDESGDDGFPNCSSPFFVLTATYLHFLDWQDTFSSIYRFRQALRETLGLPVRLEFHTKHWLLNKQPYRRFGISDSDRIGAVDAFCEFIAQLDLNIINVVIDKPAIRSASYNVLDHALTYSIQRIENHLRAIGPTHRFLIISDPGRIGKMRSVARRVQRFNYIPSLFGSDSYRREIRSLLEDPLPKDSEQSYFIQVSDFVAYIVYLHTLSEKDLGFSNRMPSAVDGRKVTDWMEALKGSLNLDASRVDPYGIVCFPK